MYRLKLDRICTGRLSGRDKLLKTKLVWPWFGGMRDMEYTKERLQELLQNMLGAMVIYQVQGERFVPFLYTATVPGYSGMTEEEYLKLYGQDSLPIVAPSDRPALQGLLKQVVEQDGS